MAPALPQQQQHRLRPPRRQLPLRPPPPPVPPPAPPPQPAPVVVESAPPLEEPAGPLSPLVRKMARENNIDLSQVKGTGAGNRITNKNLETYLASKKQA